MQSGNKADKELTAMAAVRAALADLDEDSRFRVLGWVTNYYGYVAGRPGQETASRDRLKPDSARPEDDDEGASRAGTGQTDYSDAASLYHAANPATESDRALVGGYWFQVLQGGSDFGSSEVNKELNQLGYRVSNITRALSVLIEQRPALVIQVRKSGKAPQSHKRYRLTDQGIRRVRQMLTTDNLPAAE